MKYTIRSHRLAVLLPAAGLMVFAACAKKEAPAQPLALATSSDSARAMAAAHAMLGPEAKAALDRGNEAFKKKDYTVALKEYRDAATLAPQHSAPLFGIYMVAKARNDVKLADSAMAGIRERGGSMTAPGGTLHPATPPADGPHAAMLPRKSGN